MITLGIKGGHNEESHNHNDIGTFILHVDGENLITDLGAGEYTKDYFGDKRYDILCNSSRSRSVPIIDGKYQECGKVYRAEQMKSEIHTEQFIDHHINEHTTYLIDFIVKESSLEEQIE